MIAWTGHCDKIVRRCAYKHVELGNENVSKAAAASDIITAAGAALGWCGCNPIAHSGQLA